VLAEQVGRPAGVGVATGFSLWVDPGWWDELGQPVGTESHLPFSVVDDGVVALAQQRQVGQARGAAISPMNDMVANAPGKRLISRSQGRRAPYCLDRSLRDFSRFRAAHRRHEIDRCQQARRLTSKYSDIGTSRPFGLVTPGRLAHPKPGGGTTRMEHVVARRGATGARVATAIDCDRGDWPG
jgi:hypothetical protein